MTHAGSSECVFEGVIHVAAACVCRASSGRNQALRRKHDRIDSGFVLLVFHILNQAVDVVVNRRKFTKSPL